MKFKNIDLKDLRKRYADSDEFCIKIREKENDIVYYNGIKAFEIQHDKKENYEIKMPDNIYNFNKTNMKENNNILEGITELRKNMSKYFLKSIDTVKIAVSYAQYKNPKQDINKKLEKILDNIKNEINNKKYDEYIYIDSKNIVANFNEQYKKFQDYESELRKNLKNDMEELNKKIKDLRKKEIKYEIKINVQEDNITDIANIEYLIIKNFIFDENMKYKRVFSIPEFTSNQTQVDDEVEIETFETDIKNAVKNYEKVTGTEVEKKYQHYFMISKLLNRKLKNFKNIYRFEEEYYTSEKKNDDENKGRIDCVFAKIDENSKSCYNTEIYLIELKVDENVIDGTNGINKHLIDIGKINFNEFKERLEARINYRRKQVLGEDIADIKINPNKFHFWTIIAISNKKHAENVAEKLIKLTDKEKVKQDNLLPKESKVIDEQIEQTKIDQLKKETEVDVRFLFDKNSSDGENYDLSETYLFEQPLPFKDMTKEKFMKMWKENKII